MATEKTRVTWAMYTAAEWAAWSAALTAREREAARS